jgi:hypothetical protein
VLLSPVFHDTSAGALGLSGPGTIRLAALRKVAVMGAAPLTALRRMTRRKLEAAPFPGRGHRPPPGMVLALSQHAPDQHRELPGCAGSDDVPADRRPGDRGRGDMVAAPGAHPFVERPHRARAAHRLPGGLDRKVPGIAATTPGDPAVMGPPAAGLPDCRTAGRPD